jgi:NAD(P)H-hydrate epimerase
MTGALVLASKSASLAGAGLVVTGIAKSLNPILETKLTEQMSLPLEDDGNGYLTNSALPQIKEKINWCDVLLIGPGSGREKEILNLLEKALLYGIEQKKKIIIDADALFLLSEKMNLLKNLNENCILTPHHGEFLRIFSKEKNLINTQPWQSLKNALEEFPCVINLKGAPSLCGQKEKGIFINTTGNPGLAKGGSGDLLGGLIAGFAVSGMDLTTACYYANFIHGKAADESAEKWGTRAFSMENLLSRTKKVYRKLCLQ